MSSSGLGATAAHPRPSVGIIGGSGLCTFPELSLLHRVRPVTQYGAPSDDILIGECGGRVIAFLPRHGEGHTIPPHKVPYKANLAALKELGVRHVVGTCIVGSLKREIPPGSMIVLDQFVNLTWGRDDYFDADRQFVHLPMARPYCETLRRVACEVASGMGLRPLPQGTVAVIQGPRFSTIAESQWLAANGWDVVNMTQYPECSLARELGLCYAAVAWVTDYDVGVSETAVLQDPDHIEDVVRIFRENVRKTRAFLLAFVEKTADGLACTCASHIAQPYFSRDSAMPPTR